MEGNSETPAYFYKIVPAAPSEPLPAEYPLSELDAADGFIHFSTAAQVPNTCNLFFNNVSTLWVLKLDAAKLTQSSSSSSSIKWENGFPHLYGGNFGAAEILSSQKFERGQEQKWSDTMVGSSWLE
ncbi:hypothetical protein N3K66_004260 [Trichothecium roseum]|uniref:Uncharacterized protein n=1 Tax=Trichothecium roseum TaxID=47278 RepID=A0ACC0V2F1_9HYPO|nr:hypothetical protein N3K66_004260 [Trichothecium roseum]